jgi:NitT/TauT family transport system substrate-binding protein
MPARRAWIPRCLLIPALVAVSAPAAGGCSSATATVTPAGPEKPDITVAAVPASGAAGLYIAQDEGLFKRHGLHVTILPSVSATVVLAELRAGRIDVSLGQYTADILAQAKGIASLKILAEGNMGGPGTGEVLVPGGSAVKTPAQLKGKTIAVNVLNGLAELEVMDDLKGYGITADQVHFTAIPFPSEAAALNAGQVSAAYMVEPYISQAEMAAGAKVLLDTNSGATMNFPVEGYAVTRAWAQKYPRTAAAFAAAIDQGQDIAGRDKGEAEKVLVKFLGITPRVASVMSLGTYPDRVDPAPLTRVGVLMQTFPAVSGLASTVNVAQVIKELTR